MPSFKVELFKPSVPPLEKYLPYLQQIDENKFYSNFGPISLQFKRRLSSLWGLQETNLELFSNGTMALVSAMVPLKKKNRPYCILPSWTFVATAQAVVAAGLEPYFVDVDYGSMQLTSHYLKQVPIDIVKKTSLICIVAPFGAPLNLEGVEEFAKLYDLEVICDCAAGFESFKPNNFHSIISLHATKTFGIGEGGVLISNNQDLLQNAKAYSNFGFKGNRKSDLLGVNAKLSEFHAAVGMGALDNWESVKLDYYKIAEQYLNELSGADFEFQDGWGINWISSTCVVRYSSQLEKKKSNQKMSELGIQTRDWWNQGCIKEPAFESCSHAESFENTNTLVTTTLGIPFHQLITDKQLDLIKTIKV